MHWPYLSKSFSISGMRDYSQSDLKDIFGPADMSDVDVIDLGNFAL